MFLVELVLQGVRGFRELVRLRFQSGFNIVTAGNEAGKTTAVDAVVRLLFPSGVPGRIIPFVSRTTPDASRAAVVVFSDDRSYYRVIQDFSKQAVNLSQYSAATKDFALIHKDWDSAERFMAGLTAGLTEEEFANLFVLRRDHYADRAPFPGVARAAAPAPRRNNPVPRAGAAPGQEARIAELKETLRKAEEAGDAEYRLDSAKIRLNDIAKKMDELEDMNARFAEMDSNLSSLKGCETLPENLDELLDAHEQRQGQKMARSDDLQQDIEGLRMQLEVITKAPLWKDMLFIAGVVVGAASLIAGLFILTAEQADYFPIGVLLALILVSAGWYRTSRRNAQRKIVQREIEAFEADREEVEKSFEEGGTAIMEYMRATSSAAAAELREKADNYRHFASLRRELLEQRQHILGGVTVQALQGEFAKQQQEVIELERAARAVAQNAVDTYSLRQEIERFESASPGGASWDFGSPEDAAFPGFGAASPEVGEQAQGGVFLPQLEIASRIGGIEMETLIPAVEAAAQRNLAAVSMGKYVKVEVGHGSEPVVHDRNDAEVAMSALSHGTKDLLYFCLRTGLVEALAGKLRLPFVLDDALAGFDPARQQAACQVLRALGAKTQVILFTSNPALRTGSDAAAELK